MGKFNAFPLAPPFSMQTVRRKTGVRPLIVENEEQVIFAMWTKVV